MRYLKTFLLIIGLYSYCNSQNIGYFNYGQTGKASWSNHLVINSAGELVMAGYLDSKPCLVIADVTGAYITNRVVASSGELFTAAIDASDNIYGGGYYGSIGAENKYIVKYSPAMAQLYTKNYGAGNIRYIIMDGTDVVAAGFNSKPCILKTDANGNLIWYKEFTIAGKDADAYMIHQVGSNYYMTGSLDEGGNARSYVLSVDAATGNVNWCKTYVGASFSPHFTGMCASPSGGLILCGATAASTGGNPGNLVIAKIDLSGNIIWTRQVNGQYSWYMRNPTQMGNSWGISCAMDPYGAVVVAGETNNNYSMLVKLVESTGNVMWCKRYGNGGGAGASDDGFHGLTINGCTYLASGWMGPNKGSGWDFGLVVTDTSGFAGASATCGSIITPANSVPTINTANPTITSANLTTANNYSGQNNTASMSRVAICANASSYSLTAVTSTLCSGGSTTLSVNSGASSYNWASTDPGSISGSTSSPSIVVTPTAPTNYTCFVGGASGCLAMLTISVSPSAASGGPTVTVNSATLSCTNTTATLTATGGGTYSWSGPGIVSGGNSASAVINQPGTYTVSVTSGGCTTTTTTAVSSVGGGTLSVSSQTNVNCFGANTGTATVVGNGGTGPYTYTWSPGNLNGASQTNLSAGTYTITMNDANGCPGTTTLQITQPASSITAVMSTTAASCGSSNGVASVSASGGTAGYTYNWAPSGGTSATASGLASGNYSVTITDAKNCTLTAIANITSASGPTISVSSQTNVNCFGANTGTATVVGNGGTGPYTYTWSPGNLNGASQTNLSAGTYTITMNDANGCPGTTTLQITQPASSITAVMSTTAASCGSSNGVASVSASGGTAGYTYNWAPSGGTSATASGLASGNYSVTITDANSCTLTAIANITSANGPTLSVSSQTNVNCFGANTGTATVAGSGGTGPYTYTWSPGNLNGASQTSLGAGTYTINVSDAGGCVGTNTLIITQPASSITAVMSTTAASCGSSNGVASVSASGGTAGYTYNWAPSGVTSATASGLSSGNYSVTITDANSCTLTAIANITSASGPTLSVSSQTNVNCFGTNTGTATVAGSGGTGPYTYTWSPGNLNGASQTSLSAGTYTINVSDAGGCIGTNTLTITQPATGLSGAITNSPTGCGNNVGSATVTVSGGTPTYSYSWSPTSGSGNSITGLGAGNISVLVTDNNGCTISFSTTINSSGTGPTLSVASQTNVNCTNANSGAATINTSGTGPYTYTWVPTGGNTVTATGLGAGNYTVFVSDAALCTSTIAVSIAQSPSVALNITSTNASCMDNDGEASVTISGGTAPTTILWSNNSTTSTISGLSTGSYSVLVTDANGCTASGTTNIMSVGTLTVNINNDVTIMEGQSTPLLIQVPANASVFWTPVEGLSCTNCPNPIASPTVTTEYCALSIVGTCTNTSCTNVTVKIDCSSNSDYSTPNAFTPNGDGINDEFCLKGWKKCINTFYIAIYNRWGEKVYDSDDADFCWDGKFRGTLLNAGVFVFYIKASLDDGSNITRKGNINLIR